LFYQVPLCNDRYPNNIKISKKKQPGDKLLVILNIYNPDDCLCTSLNEVSIPAIVNSEPDI